MYVVLVKIFNCSKDNLGGPKSDIRAFWSESLGGFLVDEESTKKNTVSEE